MRIPPVLVLSVLLHGYIGWRIVPALGAWPLAQGLAAGLLVASALLMPLALWARRMRSRQWSDALSWVGLTFMGLFSSLLVLTLLRDVGLLLAAIGAALFPHAVASRGGSPQSAPSLAQPLTPSMAARCVCWAHAPAPSDASHNR